MQDGARVEVGLKDSVGVLVTVSGCVLVGLTVTRRETDSVGLCETDLW